jgi:hypothetical protein
MSEAVTRPRGLGAFAASLGRGVVLLVAAVAPAGVAFGGMLVVLWRLQSLQPDGDLEPGGNFAMLMALVVTVFACYVVSWLAVLVLWSRATSHAWSILLTVVGASLVVTAISMALNWQ